VYVDVTWGFLTTQGGSPTLTLELWNNATSVASMGQATGPYLGTSPNGAVSTYGPFYVNPVTQEPWTQADIVSFDSASGLAWAVDSALTLGGSNALIGGISMRVQYVTEKRIAMGSCATQSTPPSGVQTNLPLTLKTPALVDNFAKVSGTDYLVVVSRLDTGAVLSGTSTLTPSIKYIDSGEANPHGQGTERAVTVAASGQVLTVGADATKAYAAIWGTSGGAISADSQPYHTVGAFACATGMEVRQRLTAASTGNFPALRVLVGVEPGVAPTEDLTIRVHNASGGAQVGGDVTLSWPTDLEDVVPSAFSTAFEDGPARLYELVVEFGATVPLVSATTYYVEFTSSTPVATPWMVAVLSFEETHALTGTADFGGATLYATADGTDYTATRDVPVLLLSETTAPASFTATAVVGAEADAFGGDCDPGTISYAQLTWAATALGADFDYYEIQRYERTNDPWPVLGSQFTWRTIARELLEATVSFADHEPRSNESMSYRIRVVRADGGISSWVTASVTVAQADGTVLITSNADTSLAVAFVLQGPGHEWTPRTSAQRVLGEFYDRDYPAEFRPLEKGGMEYPFTVIVYASLTGTPDWGAASAAFLGLRGIAEATGLPYVCVRLPTGDRFFGSLIIPRPVTWDAQTNVYLAPCLIVETTAVPTVVEE